MKIAFIIYSHSIGGAEHRYYNAIHELALNPNLELQLYTIPRLIEKLELRSGKLPENVEVISLFPQAVLPLFNWLDFSFYKLSPLIGRIGVKGLRYLALKMTRSFQKFFYRKIRDVDVVHSVFLTGMPRRLEDDITYVLSVVYTRAESLYKSERNFEYLVKNGGVLEILSGEILNRLLRNDVIKEGECRYRVSPCSFIDYSKCKVSPKQKLITFCGRLEKIKNPDMFVGACLVIAAEFPEYEFRILGDGPMRSTVIEELNTSQFKERFSIGHSNDPVEVLSVSEVFVSCQSFDNYPSQSLLEAMACGCKIVATNVGETPSLIDSEFGVLVEENPEALADGLRTVITDAAFVGEKAGEFVMHKHTVERYTDHLLSLYEKSVNEFRRG